MATNNPVKKTTAVKILAVFTYARSWPYLFADLAYQNDNMDAINQYCQQKNNEGRGFGAVIFDSHTGYQCEWPMLNDDGKLISSDEEFQHCLKQLSELECTPYIIPLAHIDNESNRPLRNNIKNHLQKGIHIGSKIIASFEIESSAGLRARYVCSHFRHRTKH